MWPFKKKTPTHLSFPIGVYKLNASVNDLQNLVEFSDAEYASIPKTFVGGENFNAPPVKFLNIEWQMSLGTVDNIIYKIAPYLLIKDKNEANAILMQILQYCNQELGPPSDQKIGFIIWDTIDCNVLLQTGENGEEWAINLFITSSNVRNFKLLT
jgi:hypothetical protein